MEAGPPAVGMGNRGCRGALVLLRPGVGDEGTPQEGCLIESVVLMAVLSPIHESAGQGPQMIADHEGRLSGWRFDIPPAYSIAVRGANETGWMTGNMLERAHP